METARSAAYDLSLFEPKKHGEQRREGGTKRRAVRVLPQVRGRGAGVASTAKTAACALVAFAAAFLIMAGNARIAEVDNNINNMQTRLTNVKSDAINLQVRLESRMSLNRVESYAVKKLGLSKIQNYQITYINVDKGDKVKISGASNNPVLRFLGKIEKEVQSYFN